MSAAATLMVMNHGRRALVRSHLVAQKVIRVIASE